MKTNIKVAGTTFHKIPSIGIAIAAEFMDKNVPCANTEAILQPEPENPYDKKAVKVIVPLKDGQAFQIGYLPKEEPIKRQITAIKKAKLLIRDYGQVGTYNASFVITEVEGL